MLARFRGYAIYIGLKVKRSKNRLSKTCPLHQRFLSILLFSKDAGASKQRQDPCYSLQRNRLNCMCRENKKFGGRRSCSAGWVVPALTSPIACRLGGLGLAINCAKDNCGGSFLFSHRFRSDNFQISWKRCNAVSVHTAHICQNTSVARLSNLMLNLLLRAFRSHDRDLALQRSFWSLLWSFEETAHV